MNADNQYYQQRTSLGLVPQRDLQEFWLALPFFNTRADSKSGCGGFSNMTCTVLIGIPSMKVMLHHKINICHVFAICLQAYTVVILRAHWSFPCQIIRRTHKSAHTFWSSSSMAM